MSWPQGVMISIGALSRASGIPVETLRTWERRYGYPAPARKPSGHRLYPAEGIARLRNIAEAIARGHRIGDVIRVPEAQLARLLEETPLVPDGKRHEAPMERASRPGTSGPAAAPDFGAEIERALLAVSAFDGESLTRQLFSAWARFGPVSFLRDYVGPMLESVGSAWQTGRLQIRHEHFLTQRLSDVLRTARMPLEELAHGPRVVLATLPGEEHGLGLEMAALLFAHADWRCVLLGTQVPEEEIAAAATQRGAGAVALSISVHSPPKSTIERIGRVRSLLPESTPLIVGGKGAPDLPGIETMRDFDSLHAWAARTAALAASSVSRATRPRRAPARRPSSR